MYERAVTFLSQGHKISAIITYPDNPTNKAVIFAHGLSNSKQPGDAPLLYAIDRALVAQQFMTMRFDFYGSGESSGEFRDKTISLMWQNYFDAVTFLRHNHPGLLFVGAVGKSIGGTVLGLSGADSRINAHVIITTRHELAPFFSSWWHGQDELALGAAVPPTGVVKGDFSLQKKFFIELPAIDAKFKRGLSHIHNALIISNEGDEKIAPESAEQLRVWAGNTAKSLVLPGHDHELKGYEDIVTLNAVRFLQENTLY